MQDGDHEGVISRKLQNLFPYDVARPTQSAALEFIARMFEKSVHLNIIEAPTGTGKSALAIAAARYAEFLYDDEYEPGAYILTPYNNLADQMSSEFRHLGAAALRGRTHYLSGPCATYENARRCFTESAIAVTNYAYFLRAGHLPDRQALVLDEAHTLERSLLDLTGFRITLDHCRAIGIGGPPTLNNGEREHIVDWLAMVLLPALRKQADRCRDLTARSSWEELTARVLTYCESDDRSQWFTWTDRDGLNVKSLSVAPQAQQLFSRARFVLIQSATIFDFATFRRILGISDQASVFTAPSEFPLRNRPIFSRPVGDMAVNTLNAAMPSICMEAEHIVNNFDRSKGVVHTHSYAINRVVYGHLAAKFGNRIVSHGPNPRERQSAIHRHCSSEEPSVLVSPSLAEGVDLKDDLARFQIVCKLPYPRLDPYTRARCSRDRGWYELQTAWGLAQMIGRAVRSQTDSAATFVLDSQFGKFVARNEEILPSWWRAAIHWERIAA